MRDELPFELNHRQLGEFADDLDRRLKFLCKKQKGTESYSKMKALVALSEWLSKEPSRDPKYDFLEYDRIWSTIANAFTVTNLEFDLFTAKEVEEFKRIRDVAHVTFFIAALNAALKGLKGTDLGDDSTHEFARFVSMDLQMWATLCNAKDYFTDRRWFGKDEENRVMRAIYLAKKEASKRTL